jgi:hypothetical protein
MRATLSWLLIPVLLSACAKRGCEGPPLEMDSLRSLKTQGIPAPGPRSYLVLPNPIDATSNPAATVSDSKTLQSGNIFNLTNLLAPTRLDNSFIKVRVRTISDSVSSLASPNNSGDFNFPPQDIRYSQTMAYRSLTTIQSYVEGLGFSVVKSRPLFVMVQAEGSTSQEVNAFYDHAYLNPSAPRTIKLYGSSSFAPGVDQDMYWHEFGHLFNESITAERGIDFAGDNGAIWTEGSALHECLADYLSESASDKDYIGKWIARNIGGFRPGDPLRWASDRNGKPLDFRQIARADGTGAKPERYEVAEWCTRVLWDIRQSFIEDYGADGPTVSDRFVFSAASLLGRDSSISQFRDALVAANEDLHCGGYGEVIQGAFERRGFVKAETLPGPLGVTGTAVTVRVNGTSIQPTPPAPGASVVFSVRIQNTFRSIARNVRMKLSSSSALLIPKIYQQGLGDLEAGRTLNVGTSDGLPSTFSVLGEIDSRAPVGSTIPYTLTILTENGPDAVLRGEVRL